jgi:hypothetical protein
LANAATCKKSEAVPGIGGETKAVKVCGRLGLGVVKPAMDSGGRPEKESQCLIGDGVGTVLKEFSQLVHGLTNGKTAERSHDSIVDADLISELTEELPGGRCCPGEEKGFRETQIIGSGQQIIPGAGGDVPYIAIPRIVVKTNGISGDETIIEIIEVHLVFVRFALALRSPVVTGGDPKKPQDFQTGPQIVFVQWILIGIDRVGLTRGNLLATVLPQELTLRRQGPCL